MGYMCMETLAKGETEARYRMFDKLRENEKRFAGELECAQRMLIDSPNYLTLKLYAKILVEYIDAHMEEICADAKTHHEEYEYYQIRSSMTRLHEVDAESSPADVLRKFKDFLLKSGTFELYEFLPVSHYLFTVIHRDKAYFDYE